MTRKHWKTPRAALLCAIALLITLTPLLHVAPVAAQDGGTTHTVQAGENLFRIALNYGLSAEYLASINGIPDPTKIYVGQVLIIPGDEGAQTETAVTAPAYGVDSPAVNPAPVIEAAPAPATAPEPAPVVHTVQPGEHLAAIADQYGVEWEDIATANALDNPSVIHSGQQLIIPDATADADTEPTADTAPPAV
ncbi:MAG: LysM peptidoglycan-binding domain-containing protein, partial [Anaerolineae bacterium]|nr:LysM peptidoglycan-binding domain-containing protein [Anaerolineae bacterium]